MIRLIIVLASITVLSACQSVSERSEDSPFYMVPGGSALILNTDILIPPNSVRIFIQEGRLAFGANQYYPYCHFEVRNLATTPQLVKPDRFEIYKTRRVTDLFAGIDSRYLFASMDIPEGRGLPSPIVYGTQMFLRSATQPEVFKLMCGHMQDPNITARHLTIQQIRAALGDIFSLQLPAVAQDS